MTAVTEATGPAPSIAELAEASGRSVRTPRYHGLEPSVRNVERGIRSYEEGRGRA